MKKKDIKQLLVHHLIHYEPYLNKKCCYCKEVRQMKKEQKKLEKILKENK